MTTRDGNAGSAGATLTLIDCERDRRRDDLLQADWCERIAAEMKQAADAFPAGTPLNDAWNHWAGRLQDRAIDLRHEANR